MKRFVVILMSAALLAAGCTSGAAPGADDVVNQTEKAKQLEKDLEERNSELEDQP